jgi:hypothetical protein
MNVVMTIICIFSVTRDTFFCFYFFHSLYLMHVRLLRVVSQKTEPQLFTQNCIIVSTDSNFSGKQNFQVEVEHLGT